MSHVQSKISFNTSSKEGYHVIQSYSFINDGPELSKDYSSQQLEFSVTSEQNDCHTSHVPSGVLHMKPAWKPVKLDEKPPFSYATIIAHAILSSERRKLTLNEIYQWISEQYPCYSMKDHRWKNSIRHNLSLQKAFVKLDRDSSVSSGKGRFWTILPGYEQQFIGNLVARGMGGTNTDNVPTTQHQCAHKQSKRLTNPSNKPPSHLFAVFRMNPTQTSSTSTSCIQKKKRANRTGSKAPPTSSKHGQEDNDSDCDSGVDLRCGALFPKGSVSQPTEYSTLLHDTMLKPQDLLLDNSFDKIPWSIIMNSQESLFGDVYWPQTQQAQYDLPQPLLDCYFDTSFSLPQQQQQQKQDYLLYNDFLSSQIL